MLFLLLVQSVPVTRLRNTRCACSTTAESMNVDPVYMHRCIQLALLGAGNVAPNPMVGAVLVYNNQVIGEGYHRQYGQAHAELNCIRDAETRFGDGMILGQPFNEVLEKSTLYVSLEPCAHFGKTPPCADLIIEKAIRQVVVGCRDPFMQVDGKGIEKLQTAGIEVVTGLLEEECTAVNRRFLTFHTKHRPWILLKWAQSADGNIALHNRSRVYISNDITNRLVHKWRNEEAAIMVGTNTALADDPSLTTRLWPGNNPVRMAPDMHLRLPQTLQIFNGDVQTIIFNGIRHESQDNITYYRLQPDRPVLPQMVQALYRLNILSVLVEGGTALLQSFIDAGLWDEARIITNNELMLPGGLPAPRLPGAVINEHCSILSDTIRCYVPVFKAHEALPEAIT